jgi:hypothetical protein
MCLNVCSLNGIFNDMVYYYVFCSKLAVCRPPLQDKNRCGVVWYQPTETGEKYLLINNLKAMKYSS